MEISEKKEALVNESIIDKHRYFLKDSIRKIIDFGQTDQNRGVRPPAIQKPYRENAEIFDLTPVGEWRGIGKVSVEEAIASRRSRRSYSDEPLSIDELSFLLWATQGIRIQLNAATAFRTVPSAGARHPFETYLCVLNVEGLEQGIYRYLPLEHKLLFEFATDDLRRKVALGAFDQRFVGSGAVVFVWSAIPYRTEWRYHAAAHKVILIDVGHVCQNLYLACEAINAGTCAIAAYDQEMMDRLLRLNGKDEFTIYMAPVGKRKGE